MAVRNISYVTAWTDQVSAEVSHKLAETATRNTRINVRIPVASGRLAGSGSICRVIPRTFGTVFWMRRPGHSRSNGAASARNPRGVRWSAAGSAPHPTPRQPEIAGMGSPDGYESAIHIETAPHGVPERSLAERFAASGAHSGRIPRHMMGSGFGCWVIFGRDADPRMSKRVATLAMRERIAGASEDGTPPNTLPHVSPWDATVSPWSRDRTWNAYHNRNGSTGPACSTTPRDYHPRAS